MLNEKQRYYASLERQRAAESALRAGTAPAYQGDQALEELYIDMGMRAFAAFQNCLDWLGNIGNRKAAATAAAEHSNPALADTLGEIANSLLSLREQLSRIESAVANLEAGMRRIDKYTLDAFRQLTELDALRAAETPQQDETAHTGHRRLPKEEARRLAIEAAQNMAKSGQILSLAAVARTAGLKYGQIVYAFGNKENFMNELEAIRQNTATAGSANSMETEVAVSVDQETAS